MATTKAQLLPLTGIRFFLVLWILIFHQTVGGGFLVMLLPQLPDTVTSVVKAGNLAVGLFYVLSGFVLSYNHSLATSWNSSRLIRFGVARFARIYPAYCFGLMLVAPFVGYSIVKGFSMVRLAKAAGVAFLQWTLLQSWIPKFALAWNPPGWSLSNEAFFYLCFPFVGVLLWKLSRLKSLFIAGLILCAAASIVPLLIRAMFLRDLPANSPEFFWEFVIRYNPLVNLPDFCIGILIGRAYQQLCERKSSLLGHGYWLYVPGLLLELLLIAYPTILPQSYDALRLPLHSLFILGLALGGGIFARFLSLQAVVFFGNASYAMYIVHFPVAMWMNVIAERLFSTQLSGMGAMLLYVIVVMCLSAVVFKVIEEPTNRFLKKTLTAKLDKSRQKNTDALLNGIAPAVAGSGVPCP